MNRIGWLEKWTLRFAVVGLVWLAINGFEGILMRIHLVDVKALTGFEQIMNVVRPVAQEPSTAEVFYSMMTAHPICGVYGFAYMSVMGAFLDTRTESNFGNLAGLLGYDLDTTRACPGGKLLLTLYWRRQGPPIPERFKVFVHVEGDRLWAQSDREPGCDAWPTSTWRAGEVIVDRHLLDLPAAMPPGVYNLDVGLYEPQTGVRLERLDAAGRPLGNALTLTSVDIPLFR